jgi:hypothetical protein
MAEFEKVIPAQGGDPIYRNVTENKPVKKEDLPEAVREELDLADPGTRINDELIVKEEGDGLVDINAKKNKDAESDKSDKPAAPKVSENHATSAQRAAQKAANGETTTKQEDTTEEESVPSVYSQPVPQSTPGMGFPRKDGKTVDFFDGETPHTKVRAVAGFAVPLSDENYNSKSDTDIYKKLVEDGYINE